MDHIATLNSCVIPDGGPRRNIWVKPKYQTDHYRDGFDADTLWYDAFSTGQQTVLICPPLHNLAPLILNSDIRIDGAQARISRVKKHLRHCVVTLDQAGQHLNVSSDHGMFSSAISDNISARFVGKNCHVAISKDNDLTWIRDFARFNIQHHGLEAMVLFDNGSTSYDLTDLSDALGETGLSDWLIVPAPFRYGPKGKKPFARREKFLQTALFNIARLRFLTQARAVLNCDIDELVVMRDGSSIFDLAVQSRLGFVRFPGIWYSPGTPLDRMALHRDHQFRKTDTPAAPAKYCIVPDGPMRRFSWDTHVLEDMPLPHMMPRTKRAFHMHCRAVTTGWKNPGRADPFDQRAFDPEVAALLERTDWG